MATAARLFCKNGINATGIDAIIAAAGVAKTTLYANFRSKNELVAAVLEAEARAWQDWLLAALDRGHTPREQLEAIFPALRLRLSESGASGSLLVSAVGEHDKEADWVRDIAARHSMWLCNHLAGLAAAAGAHRPGVLARQLVVLLDGAVVAAMITRDADAAEAAGAAATALLDAACGQRKGRRTRQIGLQGGAAALAKEDLGEDE